MTAADRFDRTDRTDMRVIIFKCVTTKVVLRVRNAVAQWTLQKRLMNIF